MSSGEVCMDEVELMSTSRLVNQEHGFEMLDKNEQVRIPLI